MNTYLNYIHFVWLKFLSNECHTQGYNNIKVLLFNVWGMQKLRFRLKELLFVIKLLSGRIDIWILTLKGFANLTSNSI